jgi:hypothetical protein
MADVVVTVPQTFQYAGAPGRRGLEAWLAEGDAPGSPWSGELYSFTTGGARPTIEPGERVYVVCAGRLVGFAPLVRVEFWHWGRFQDRGRVAFIRGGGAVAVTIAEPITGFRGWRYRWWQREQETPLELPAWFRTNQAT